MYYKTRKIFSKIKEIALSNGEDFHLAAALFRGKRVVRIGTNSTKTHPRFRRVYSNGEEGSCLHAEMEVLRFSEPGDTLLVVRFLKDGTLSMAKPCKYCQEFIIESGIKQVTYSDWDGEMISILY